MTKKKDKKQAIEQTAYGEANAATVLELMEGCHAAQVPLMIVGDPGIGKSAMVEAYAKEHGLGMWCLVGSYMEPQDIAGLPHAAEDSDTGMNYTEYIVPPWQKEIMNGNVKVLFLDEFSNSPASIQSGELKLVGERRFANGEKMPDDVLIIMAMNPESSAVDYTPIASPMANRMMFVSYLPSDREVYEGLTGGWFTDEEKAAWSDSERKWRDLIVDFLKSTNGTYILKINHIADGDMDSSAPAWLHPESENSESEREILCTAWPSPRSWDNAARLLGKFDFVSKEINAFQERILSGMVGREASVYLKDYVHRHHQIDAFDLILHPEKQDWHVSAEDGASYNDVLEIANAICAKIPKCDGLNGRPDCEQALQFLYDVIDLGGGAHFMNRYCQGGEVRDFFKKNRPSHITQREWTKRMSDLLVKFRNAELIPERQTYAKERQALES